MQNNELLFQLRKTCGPNTMLTFPDIKGEGDIHRTNVFRAFYSSGIRAMEVLVFPNKKSVVIAHLLTSDIPKEYRNDLDLLEKWITCFFGDKAKLDYIPTYSRFIYQHMKPFTDRRKQTVAHLYLPQDDGFEYRMELNMV